MKRSLQHNHHRFSFTKHSRLYIILVIILTICFILNIMWEKPPKHAKTISPINQQIQNYKNHLFAKNKVSSPFNGEKIVHLDLKGAPPKISYYYKLLPLLASLGATGILLEYEDMFPYSGPLLGNISALNSYSLDDIKTINTLAKQSNLKVIPLVQTFGHLEFLLKLAEFKDYREVVEYPQVICPTHKNTLTLLMDMVEQIIKAHPDSNIIHIGADEVYYLGLCDRCTNKMFKRNFNKNMLFLDHVNSLTGLINEKFPYLRILVWDDEFRSISKHELKKFHLHSSIEPVVWKYTKDVYDELGPSLWNVYADTFPKLWIASTFKGATGSNQIISDATHYIQNHRSWLSVVEEHKNRINFQGIIITGWQRYDHFAILCELLPVGIPSLAMSLRLLLGYNDSPISPPTKIAKLLQCEQPYALIGPVFGSPKCAYPGGSILELVIRLQQLRQEFELIINDSRIKGWLNNYNIIHAFSSPQYIETVTEPLNRILHELNSINNDLNKAMQVVYDEYTIEEWRETYLLPFIKRVEQLWNAKEVVLAKDSWPRRPLPSGDNDKNKLEL